MKEYLEAQQVFANEEQDYQVSLGEEENDTETLTKRLTVAEIEKELMIAQSDGMIIPEIVFEIIKKYKDSLNKL